MSVPTETAITPPDETPAESAAPAEPSILEVAFKGNRKEFFLWSGPEVPAVGTAVIVEADRGEDYGVVHSIGELALRRGRGTSHGFGQGRPTAKVLRLATKGDRARHDDMRQRDEPSRREAMERVRHYRLAMKLCDAEWRWDRQKLVLYFSSEQRVDFRELVRDLASRFRTRIELRQIGVRDEAKRLSGIGRCGREYCSASWLPELKPVNLGVAKDQRLSLNPTQISGACGRLMCCLRYEHDFYVQQRKRFPRDGKLVSTAKGEEKVVALDIFRERVTLRSADGEVRVLALADFNREAAGGAITEPEPETPAGDDGDEGVMPVVERRLPVQERRPPRADTRPGRGGPPKAAAPSKPAPPTAPPPRPPAAAPAAPADAPDAADAAANEERRRRRGRRGGRRHRPGGGGPPNASPPGGGSPS
ncbi:MAG: hypothetical protein MUF53_09365 [Gemmatimonadaceae bacterium]|nr:hypothetical protein [Gemmatimonadaceae bacterium]